MKELYEIQKELNVPKGQFNKFANFKYRSAEDILEAVKPLLKKNECVLTISDEVVNIGNRYYVKATAIFQKIDEEKAIGVSAYAREQKEKKGMDASQITGSASSYARKYALNGLFAIDDGRDADSQDNREEEKEKSEVKMVTMKQGKLLQSLGMKPEDIRKLTMLEASDKISELKEE